MRNHVAVVVRHLHSPPVWKDGWLLIAHLIFARRFHCTVLYTLCSIVECASAEDVRLAVNGAKEVDFLGRPGSFVPTVEEIVAKIVKEVR